MAETRSLNSRNRGPTRACSRARAAGLLSCLECSGPAPLMLVVGLGCNEIVS